MQHTEQGILKKEMIEPRFTWDAGAKGYISEEFAVEEQANVMIELVSRAPLVTLKKMKDGRYDIYGQSPKSCDAYKIRMTSTHEVRVRLATPVEVTKCYVMN